MRDMIGTGQLLELPLTTVLLKPICTVNAAAAHLSIMIFFGEMENYET